MYPTLTEKLSTELLEGQDSKRMIYLLLVQTIFVDMCGESLPFPC